MTHSNKLINLCISCILAFTFTLASCTDNNGIIPSIEAPNTYSFERNGSSSVSFSGQTTRIKMATELINGMKNPEMAQTTLMAMYANDTDANPFADSDLNTSSKSIKSKVAASTDLFSSNASEASIIKGQFDTWISNQVTEVYPNKEVLAVDGTAGQIMDGTSTRYVSEKGLEYNQLVSKSLIGALMVDQILNNYLSLAVLDAGDNITENDNGTVAAGKNYTTMEHKWDEAYGYLYGKSVDASTPNATIGKDDSFLNKYVGKVNGDSDFATIAVDIFDAFKLGRAAIVAKNYTVRDKQAAIIKEQISKVIGIRAVHYLQSGKGALNGKGGGFHDLSEGYGFVYSLRFTRKPDSNAPYFTKSEVDGFLDKMDGGNNSLWTVSAATLDKISNDIAAKFNFTVDQTGSQ